MGEIESGRAHMVRLRIDGTAGAEIDQRSERHGLQHSRRQPGRRNARALQCFCAEEAADDRSGDVAETLGMGANGKTSKRCAHDDKAAYRIEMGVHKFVGLLIALDRPLVAGAEKSKVS